MPFIWNICLRKQSPLWHSIDFDIQFSIQRKFEAISDSISDIVANNCPMIFTRSTLHSIEAVETKFKFYWTSFV